MFIIPKNKHFVELYLLNCYNEYILLFYFFVHHLLMKCVVLIILLIRGSPKLQLYLFL